MPVRSEMNEELAVVQPNTLNEWLTYVERLHPVGIDMGLQRVGEVFDRLKIKFTCPVVIVGGTNGKGSTCTMLEAIYHADGYRVGCSISPHLIRFTERLRLMGRESTEEELVEHFHAVESARLHPQPVSLTYFEFTTLVMARCMAMAQLDVAIFEVGLGGPSPKS